MDISTELRAVAYAAGKLGEARRKYERLHREYIAAHNRHNDARNDMDAAYWEYNRTTEAFSRTVPAAG